MVENAHPTPFEQTLTLQQAMDMATQHHRKGDLSKAENIYQQIVQAMPEQPDAIHMPGVIAHQKGDNNTAIQLLEQAIELKPNFPQATV